MVERVNKFKKQEAKIGCVMVPIGDYQQKTTYYLQEKACNPSIVLPNKTSDYVRFLRENDNRQNLFISDCLIRIGTKIRLLKKTAKSNKKHKY